MSGALRMDGVTEGQEFDLVSLCWVSILEPDYTQTYFLSSAGLELTPQLSIFPVLFVLDVSG